MLVVKATQPRLCLPAAINAFGFQSKIRNLKSKIIMSALTIIAFDYSGTLSLEAVAFGTDARLLAALQESGLYTLGVDTPEIYWRDIVEPTWDTASRSPEGFLPRMVHRLRTLCGSSKPEDVIAGAARRFINAYMEASVIHPAWGEVLRAVAADENILALVATDHYAEATPAIAGHLEQAGAPAKPLPTGGSKALDTAVIYVANSADLGAHKKAPAFWRAIARTLPHPSDHFFLIDDFGANEPGASRYAESVHIDRRRRQTEASVGEAFPGASKILNFGFGIHWHPFDPVGTASRMDRHITTVTAGLLQSPENL